jgi:hypothetical protein
MEKCKTTVTPIATGTKLSKEDKGPTIGPSLYKKLVGSIMYMTTTRPYFMYGVSLISRFMDSPKVSHWKIWKRILRYIVGTTDYGILYSSLDNRLLIGYTDRNFERILYDRKNTSSYAF